MNELGTRSGMLPGERDGLLALFDHGTKWCQNAEARDASGQPVAYDDKAAAAWDITGGMCRLFGWQRASELFSGLGRHFATAHQGPTDIDAMAALQELNDSPDTSYATLQHMIESAPVTRPL